MSYSAMVRLVSSREHPQEESEDAAELAVLLAAVGRLTGQVVLLDSGVSCHYL